MDKGEATEVLREHLKWLYHRKESLSTQLLSTQQRIEALETLLGERKSLKALLFETDEGLGL